MEGFAAQLMEWLRLISTVEYWQQLLESFQLLGPVIPILLACLESFIPALPLVAIVTLNVMAHGTALGFLYSWVGTALGCTLVFLFYRKIAKRFLSRWMAKSPKVQKALKWVSGIDPKALVMLAMMPFTPSSFLNLAFGLTDFDEKKYLVCMYTAKLVMILLLALCGRSFTAALKNPAFLVVACGLLVLLYWASKKVGAKHDLK